jgi:hypothetical protein
MFKWVLRYSLEQAPWLAAQRFGHFSGKRQLILVEGLLVAMSGQARRFVLVASLVTQFSSRLCHCQGEALSFGFHSLRLMDIFRTRFVPHFSKMPY